MNQEGVASYIKAHTITMGSREILERKGARRLRR